MDENALAKSYPREDIQTHTDCLLDNLECLKRLYPNLFADWVSLYVLLELACIYHDLGKLYPKFQDCLKNGIPYRGIPHGLLSLAFIDDKWLYKEKKLERSEIQLLFHAVAYHHDREMPFDNSDIEREFVRLQTPFDHFQYEKLPIRFLTKEGLNQRYFSVQERVNKKDEALFFRFVMLEGLLNRLDYAASAHVPVEHPNDFLAGAMDNLMYSWQQKHPESSWNDLQRYMQKSGDKNVIIIAQTGMGKTEAGLLWLGNAKGFFTLPLKSAINAIYDRIAEDVVLEKKDEIAGNR